jgi:hypothetical protein
LNFGDLFLVALLFFKLAYHVGDISNWFSSVGIVIACWFLGAIVLWGSFGKWVYFILAVIWSSVDGIEMRVFDGVWVGW